MSRPAKPTIAQTLARGERARLLQQERRMAAKAESDAVRGGVAETVSLAQDRGAEFLAPKADRGGRDKPVRRLSGLEWLLSKGRITTNQWAAGELYGRAYRKAHAPEPIRSQMDDSVRGGGDVPLRSLSDAAGARATAQARLAGYRALLNHHRTMVDALDRICGQELSPREASANGMQASALEAALLIGLDLLVATATRKAA